MMNDNSNHCLASLYNPIQKWLEAEKMHIQHLIVKNYKYTVIIIVYIKNLPPQNKQK